MMIGALSMNEENFSFSVESTTALSEPNPSGLEDDDVQVHWEDVVKRRSFLKGISIAGATLAAGAMLGKLNAQTTHSLRHLSKGDAALLRQCTEFRARSDQSDSAGALHFHQQGLAAVFSHPTNDDTEWRRSGNDQGVYRGLTFPGTVDGILRFRQPARSGSRFGAWRILIRKWLHTPGRCWPDTPCGAHFLQAIVLDERKGGINV